MSLFGMRASQMVEPSRARRGRDEAMPVPERHAMLGAPPAPPYPAGTEIAEFGAGLLLGRGADVLADPGRGVHRRRLRGRLPPILTYEEVCSGKTGHAETVRVADHPAKVSYDTC